MSALFESPDYERDICEGCMLPVTLDHVCSPPRLRRVARKYGKLPSPMVFGPVKGFANRPRGDE